MNQAPLSIPLRIEGGECAAGAVQPVTVGVPLAKGWLTHTGKLCLVDDESQAVPLQTEVLARWPDGSVKWLLLDFLLSGPRRPSVVWVLADQPGRMAGSRGARITEEDRAVRVDTGAAEFAVRRREFLPLGAVRVGDCLVTDEPAMRTVLTLPNGARRSARVESLIVETAGPVRTTLRLEGRFRRARGLWFRARLCFFAGTGLVRLRLTVRNPRRARHRGGLWDLGDPGSVLFEDLSVELAIAGRQPEAWAKVDAAGPPAPVPGGLWTLYQDSSGGENWQARNHVNRQGRVPCRVRGYQVRSPQGHGEGLRASPVVSVRTERGIATVAVPEFWQQFPKALAVEGGRVRIGLFPGEWDDSFELQGGEQKTHTTWFHFGPPMAEGPPGELLAPLEWVHRPARVRVAPEAWAASGVFAHFVPADRGPSQRLDDLLGDAIAGQDSLLARRETIDEYGWRNYGDVYADHENAHYPGPKPVVSHYNNQFDVLYGAILQQARTGDPAWSDLYGPLARHVIDVDIYHTDRDRPAYNGGLFWATDHYLSAETATHRTYSGANRPADDRPYGGGPGPEHNYATGLLHYYYLTGDRDALEAVLGLADWVIAMDDGSRTPLGLLDPGPTGLASATVSPDYHGPGRGAANSIGALLDGWAASGDRKYLDKAEELVCRTIHPRDDVAARGLLNVEARWSYTMHLAAVARYLDVKIDLGELDSTYAYAQDALVRYAAWMADCERPYFDHPEQLQYPTEAWAAQEFRKANALRLAARHADEPLRARLLARGWELAGRAWEDLERFGSKNTARAVAVLMVEGLRDAFFRIAAEPPAPKAPGEHDFGRPREFLAQRDRVRRALKTPAGLARALACAANPLSWVRAARRLWTVRN